MTTITLKEGVLNDDTLYLAGDGRVFSGNYQAIIEFYSFANEWSDRRHVKHFRTLVSADKFISRRYALPLDHYLSN